jgi:hypothetical protein
MTLSRVQALRAVLAAALLTAWPGAGGAAAYDAAASADSSFTPANGRLIEVPADVPTLEAAIAAAQPGDVILLAAGTYRGGATIPKEKHDLIIRGADRNLVIFDGKDVLLSAIEVKADRVSLENLTARHYTGNGFEWDGVDGFSGRYLTVWNVGLYGIYAIESRQGTFEHSYEGQEAPPPERDTRIAHNTVRGSGSVPVPANSPLAGFVGLGIGIAGGMDNVVEGNTVTDSARFGIALFPTLQESRNVFAPSGTQVRGNTVVGSRTADLAFSTGSGSGNCFAENQFTSSMPAAIEALLPCGAAATSSPPGDPIVGRELAIPIPEALDRLGKRPDYTTMPAPEDAETLMDPLPVGLRPFREASPLNNAPPASAEPAAIAPMAAGLFVMVVALVLVGSIIAPWAMRPRGQRPPGA